MTPAGLVCEGFGLGFFCAALGSIGFLQCAADNVYQKILLLDAALFEVAVEPIKQLGGDLRGYVRKSGQLCLLWLYQSQRNQSAFGLEQHCRRCVRRLLWVDKCNGTGWRDQHRNLCVQWLYGTDRDQSAQWIGDNL